MGSHMHTQQFEIRRPTSPDALATLRASIEEAVRLGTRTIVLGGDAVLENFEGSKACDDEPAVCLAG